MTQPGLFGEPPKRSKPTATPTDVHRLIALVVTLHERRYHEKPYITKRDGGILKRMTTRFGADMVEQRLHAFYDWDDPYLVVNAHPLTQLEYRWNALGARKRKRSSGPTEEQTRAMIATLRGDS